MKQRSIAVFGLAAAFIIVIWWMFVFSGVKSEATDVQDSIDAAETQLDTLETQVDQLKALDQAQIQAEYDSLSGKIAPDPQLAAFIREAERLRVDHDVKFVSVSPADPVQNGSVAEIALLIEIEGEYANVLHYLRALEGVDRLVVVDGISLTGGAAETGADGQASVGGPPILSVALEARMFSLSAVATPSTVATETAGS